LGLVSFWVIINFIISRKITNCNLRDAFKGDEITFEYFIMTKNTKSNSIVKKIYITASSYSIFIGIYRIKFLLVAIVKSLPLSLIIFAKALLCFLTYCSSFESGETPKKYYQNFHRLDHKIDVESDTEEAR